MWLVLIRSDQSSQETGFDISCKLSPMETICMKCQILFRKSNHFELQERLYSHIQQQYERVCIKLEEILKTEYNQMDCLSAINIYLTLSYNFIQLSIRPFFFQTKIVDIFLISPKGTLFVSKRYSLFQRLISTQNICFIEK